MTLGSNKSAEDYIGSIKMGKIMRFMRGSAFICMVVLIFTVSCNNTCKDHVLVKAITVNSDMFGAADYAIEIREDSSYRIIDYSLGLDSVTLELIDPKENSLLLAENTVTGKTRIDGNTFFFTPGFKQVNKALLRNGFMDLYIGDSFFRRLRLQKGNTYSTNYFDQKRFHDYAIFNAPKDSVFDNSYNLNQRDLIFIDSVLTSILKNKEGNNAFYKQLKVYSNSDSVLVDVNIFLKNNKSLKDFFRYYPIISFDSPTYEGTYGKLEINLSKRTFSELIMSDDF